MCILIVHIFPHCTRTQGSLACEVNVQLFPEDNAVPINTTLSNCNDTRAMAISAVLAPDFALSENPEGVPLTTESGAVRESGRKGMTASDMASKVILSVNI